MAHHSVHHSVRHRTYEIQKPVNHIHSSVFMCLNDHNSIKGLNSVKGLNSRKRWPLNSPGILGPRPFQPPHLFLAQNVTCLNGCIGHSQGKCKFLP
jgi:hypothetical protein